MIFACGGVISDRFSNKGDASSYALLTAAMGSGAAAGGVFFAGRKGIRSYKVVSAALLFGLAVLSAAALRTVTLRDIQTGKTVTVEQKK